jgi:hypothetical protein
VINLFNPKPHFTSKHEGYWTKLTSEARTRKAEEPVLNLHQKKKVFLQPKTSCRKQRLQVFLVVYNTAKQNKPFSDSEFMN